MFAGTSMDSKLPSVCSFVDKYYSIHHSSDDGWVHGSCHNKVSTIHFAEHHHLMRYQLRVPWLHIFSSGFSCNMVSKLGNLA